MSGIIGSKLNIRGSGLVAKLGTDGQVLTSAGAGLPSAFEDVAGGISWQSVVTASTLTAVAGNGYPIDTTSNTCTITLPASASAGDEIIFKDYARNWGTNKIIIDSNGLKYQGDDDSFDVNIPQMVKVSISFMPMQLKAGFQLVMMMLPMYLLKEMITEYLLMVMILLMFR